MRKKIIVAILASTLAVTYITGCSASTYQDSYDEAKKQIDEQAAEMQKEIDKKVDEIMNGDKGSETEKPEKQTAPTSDIESKSDKREETEKTEKENTEKTETKEIAAGAHDIAGSTFYFSKSVINDVTGNWRISTVNTSMSAEEYAAEYYEELFASNDEIHGIVNFALSTTSRITVLDSKTLDVTIMEYVDGEEHDAKELFSGMTLANYQVDIESGKAEKIE